MNERETDFRNAREGDLLFLASGKKVCVKHIAASPPNNSAFIEIDMGSYIANFNFNGELEGFSELGQVLFWSPVHIDPPPRPKRKVKKVVEAWRNIYPDYYTTHESKRNADNCANRNTETIIACVRLTGEYEVEE